MEDDDERVKVRRGVEHVRIKGTPNGNDEWGEIVQPQVTVPAREQEVPEGEEPVHLDDEAE